MTYLCARGSSQSSQSIKIKWFLPPDNENRRKSINIFGVSNQCYQFLKILSIFNGGPFLLLFGV